MTKPHKMTWEQAQKLDANRMEQATIRARQEEDILAHPALKQAREDRLLALVGEATAIMESLVPPEPPVEPIPGMTTIDAVFELAELRRKPEYFDPRSEEEGKAMHDRALRLLRTAYPDLPGLPTDRDTAGDAQRAFVGHLVAQNEQRKAEAAALTAEIQGAL